MMSKIAQAAFPAPQQIIVPQDKRPARWIRQVPTLEVKQLP